MVRNKRTSFFILVPAVKPPFLFLPQCTPALYKMSADANVSFLEENPNISRTQLPHPNILWVTVQLFRIHMDTGLDMAILICLNSTLSHQQPSSLEWLKAFIRLHLLQHFRSQDFKSLGLQEREYHLLVFKYIFPMKFIYWLGSPCATKNQYPNVGFLFYRRAWVVAVKWESIMKYWLHFM